MELVDVAAPNADIQLDCRWDSTAVFIDQSATKANSVAENIEDIHNNDAATTSTTRTMDENLFVGKIRSSRNTRQAALIDEEKNLRILKIKEAIEQQRQLHKIKMQAAKAELFSSLAAAKKAAKE
ncbi:unnamed protein product, partial [Tenebrio molitor]